MGYYTQFRLTTEQNQPVDWAAVHKCLTKIVIGDGHAEDVSPFYYEADSDHISSDDTMKWYDHDDDVAEMSKSFPDVIFCLEGEGEENSDMRCSYDSECSVPRLLTLFTLLLKLHVTHRPLSRRCASSTDVSFFGSNGGKVTTALQIWQRPFLK